MFHCAQGHSGPLPGPAAIGQRQFDTVDESLWMNLYWAK